MDLSDLTEEINKGRSIDQNDNMLQVSAILNFESQSRNVEKSSKVK